MTVNNPLRNGRKPAEPQEEATTELSSVVDITINYTRLFWSAIGFFAMVSGLIYIDRYVTAYERDLEKRRDISIQMIEAIESKNIVYVPVPESVYRKMTEVSK